jgi:hypothetical protein
MQQIARISGLCCTGAGCGDSTMSEGSLTARRPTERDSFVGTDLGNEPRLGSRPRWGRWWEGPRKRVAGAARERSNSSHG